MKLKPTRNQFTFSQERKLNLGRVHRWTCESEREDFKNEEVCSKVRKSKGCCCCRCCCRCDCRCDCCCCCCCCCWWCCWCWCWCWCWWCWCWCWWCWCWCWCWWWSMWVNVIRVSRVTDQWAIAVASDWCCLKIRYPKLQYIAGWWFQISFIFTPTWGNDPIWLIFFKWVETTN